MVVIVDFAILVSRRQSYIASSVALPQINAAEQQHVDDLTIFEKNVKSRIQKLERDLHGVSFESRKECEGNARRLVLDILEKDAQTAVLDSKRKWDDSGKHVLRY
ncbi:MAG: hypothetical protein P8X89_24485 [Reinekea sp.]